MSELRDAVGKVVKQWEQCGHAPMDDLCAAYHASKPEPGVCVCSHHSYIHQSMSGKCAGVVYKRTVYRSGHVVQWGETEVCGCEGFRAVHGEPEPEPAEPEFVEVPVKEKNGHYFEIDGDMYHVESALHMPDFCGYAYESEGKRRYAALPRRVLLPGTMGMPADVPVAVLFRKRPH